MKTTRIAVVEYAGAQKAAALGLIDLLATANRLHRPSRARALELVRVEEAGLREPVAPFTALILPPSLREQPPAEVSDDLARWLNARHAEGTTLCSICVGTFVLAELGLLDGRPATTHWALREVFMERFPRVELDVDRLIVDDGDVITGGGLMAWIDLGLRLVGRYLGPSTVLTTSRYFLVDPGGREQRFYRTFAPVLTHGDAPILKVQRWLQRNYAAAVTVPSMAARAGLAQRTFMRRFQRATGLKTREYMQHLRIDQARELLGLTSKSLQEVAWEVGYEDPGAFRAVFVGLVGLSPAEYRRRLGAEHSR